VVFLLKKDEVKKQTLKKQNIKQLRSPLRYPGGKTRAVSTILPYFPNIKTLFSPFFGGGSIEIALLNKGIKVYGYDIFEPLVVFWQCLITDPKKLAKYVGRHFPLEKEKFYALQKNINISGGNKYEKGAIFYVLNRSSFSGSTYSGGMSPKHLRFTMSSIERLKEFKTKDLFIDKMDFKESFKKHMDDFAYCDPPYLIKNTLYGHNGNTHRNFDHESLYEILSKRGNWILSYNDCPEIRKKYAKYRIITPTWKYGMSASKTSKELLILSGDF
jgi:DNA adenine methylase